jgi:DNA-binding MarR family transcriptional regulator
MITMANESATLANRLRPVLLRIARELRREIHSLGVTGGQVSLLIQIKRTPGITASALAERERISAPGMSGHIARLEAANLIERTRAEDRRRIGLTLTEAGDKVLTNVRKRRTAWLAEHLKGLTEDERDAIEAALPALEKLVEARGK